MDCTLIDQSGEHSDSVQVNVECSTHGTLLVSPKGFGDCCSLDGHGTPIGIEVWEGELRVIIWADINQEDPTHIIPLTGALESRRKDEDQDQT